MTFIRYAEEEASLFKQHAIHKVLDANVTSFFNQCFLWCRHHDCIRSLSKLGVVPKCMVEKRPAKRNSDKVLLYSLGTSEKRCDLKIVSLLD